MTYPEIPGYRKAGGGGNAVSGTGSRGRRNKVEVGAKHQAEEQAPCAEHSRPKHPRCVPLMQAGRTTLTGVVRAIFLLILLPLLLLIAFATPSWNCYIPEAKMAKVSSNFDEGYRTVRATMRRNAALFARNGTPDCCETLQEWIDHINYEKRSAPDGGSPAYVVGSGDSNGAIGIQAAPGAGVDITSPSGLSKAVILLTKPRFLELYVETVSIAGADILSLEAVAK